MGNVIPVPKRLLRQTATAFVSQEFGATDPVTSQIQPTLECLLRLAIETGHFQPAFMIIKQPYMKQTLTAGITAGIIFFTACNNSAENAHHDADTTTTTHSDTIAHQPSLSHDSAGAHGSLMKSMDDMMNNMKAMQLTGDFDIDFANMMIEHHQGGINMAQIEASTGTQEKLKTMAQQMIAKQKAEQQKLRDFVSSYKPSGMKHGEGELQKSMTGMDTHMKAMQTNADVDKDFAVMMIAHHEHAVNMANMQLKHGMSEELKKMARNMISDQQKEIKELKEWVKANTK